MSRRVAVIGSGLGGLVTSYLLAKQGDHVIILEHDKCPGGCLQSFVREGIRFDMGLHYVGGLGEGGPLHAYFNDLGLLALPWKELDAQEIWIGDTCYCIPTGEERWLEYMTSTFPHQRENLVRFLNEAKAIVSCPFDKTMPYWERSAWEWLCEIIDDPVLRDVLSGSSLIIELNRETLPLFAFAEIVYSYIHSSHRLVEGGQLIIDHLLGSVLSQGGEIYCNSTVTRILEQDSHVSGVQLADGKTIEADVVLSAIHPTITMDLLGENSAMRKVYRRRLHQLHDSMGCFTANLKVKPGVLDMRDRPVYVHASGSDLWCYDAPPVEHILIHFYPEQNAIDIIVPISWKQVEKWDGKPVGHRGEDYVAFKEALLSDSLRLAETAVPGITDAIENHWSSSPLTWKSYLRAHQGTAYGVMKDYRSPETTLLLPKTPLDGLYLTGQSIILHGIMGTTISGFISAQFLKNNTEHTKHETKICML